MKAKKKIFVALLFLLTLVFAACGKKANTDSKEADAGKTGKEVEVYFFHRWPNEPKKTYFDEMAKKFSEKHPNVKIRIERVINDSYKEKIGVLVSSNDIPDIFVSWSDSFAKNLVKSGKVRELDDLYKENTEWSSNIMESQKKGFTFDGKCYGVPLTIDGKAFFYNKDIFQKLGLEAPKNYDELISVLDKLKDTGYKEPLVCGLTEPWVVSHYLGPIFDRVVPKEVREKDYNTDTAEFTDPGYVEGLNIFKKLTTYMGEVSSSIDHETSRNMFMSGKSPIVYLQLAEIRYLEQVDKPINFGYFNFPAVKDGKGEQNTLEGAPEGFMLSKDAPKEAIEFLQFLTSSEAAGKFTKDTGELTAIEGGVTEKTASKASCEAYNVIKSAESITPWFDNAVDINVGDVFMRGGQSLAIDQTTPEQIMKDVQAAAAKLKK